MRKSSRWWDCQISNLTGHFLTKRGNTSKDWALSSLKISSIWKGTLISRILSFSRGRLRRKEWWMKYNKELKALIMLWLATDNQLSNKMMIRVMMRRRKKKRVKITTRQMLTTMILTSTRKTFQMLTNY